MPQWHQQSQQYWATTDKTAGKRTPSTAEETTLSSTSFSLGSFLPSLNPSSISSSNPFTSTKETIGEIYATEIKDYELHK